MMIFRTIYSIILNIAVLALATVMLVSISACSDDVNDDTASAENVRISFASPVVGGMTRAYKPDYEHGATVNGEKTPFHKDERIMVFGAHYDLGTKANLIGTGTNSEYNVNGEVAKYDPSVNAWDTDVHHYWKPNKYYMFAAYSPSDLNLFADKVERSPEHGDKKYGIAELYVKGYQTPVMGEQFDFMFSETVYEIKRPTPKVDENGNAFYNGVNLLFMHALSSIHFKVRLDPDYILDIAKENREHEASHYSIKSIVLSGVYDKADFSECAGFSYDETTKHNKYLFNPDKKKMWYNIYEEAKAYKSKGAAYDFVSIVSPITNIPYKLAGNNIEAKDIKELNDKAHIGFMIPQPLSADAKVVVTWTYNDGKDSHEYTKEVYLNNSEKNTVMTTEWLMGMRYTYTITISNEFIDFNSSYGGWDNDSNLVL